MNHKDYYSFQTRARGIAGPADVERIAREHAPLYERLVAPWLPAATAAPMADLACGHGSLLHWLQSRGFTRVEGVDASPQQVAAARSAGLRVQEAEAVAWLAQRPAGSLERLFATDFIEHLSKDECMRFLAGCARALGAGGMLILRYPNGNSPFVGLNLFNDITHTWTYTTSCLNALAHMHGFSEAVFADESDAAIRTGRWLKAPLSRIIRVFMSWTVRAATRERIVYWSPHIWACLRK